MIEIVKYSKEYKRDWDEFVEQSENSSFLFFRDYMEYHSDRFADFSMLLYEKSKLKALMPANIKNKSIYSHQGLTFGGIIHKANLSFEKLNQYYSCFFNHVTKNNVITHSIKTIPFFYFKSLTQSHDFFLQGLPEVEISNAIGAFINCKNHQFPKSSIEKRKLNLEQFDIDEKFCIEEYWPVLEINLREQHDNKPVHTLDEIILLKKKFPENIKLFSLRNRVSKKIEAGTLIYSYGNVVKMQYIATSQEGRDNRASHALYYLFIKKYKHEKDFIDMGTCMTGDDINKGLLYLKQRFGAGVYNAKSFQFVGLQEDK